MKKREIKMANGTIRKYTYEELCKELGYSAETEFVKITNAGTITFTCGKPSEIRGLYTAVTSKGFKPARKFNETVKRNY